MNSHCHYVLSNEIRELPLEDNEVLLLFWVTAILESIHPIGGFSLLLLVSHKVAFLSRSTRKVAPSLSLSIPLVLLSLLSPLSFPIERLKDAEGKRDRVCMQSIH